VLPPKLAMPTRKNTPINVESGTFGFSAEDSDVISNPRLE
jgi:hypothetical protein